MKLTIVIMLSITIGIYSMLVSKIARSSEIKPGTVDIGLYTLTFDDKYDYKENTLGIGFTFNHGRYIQYKIGVRNNEFDEYSVYSMIHPTHRINKYSSFGVNVGLVTGYSNIDGRESNTKCKHSHKYPTHKTGCVTTVTTNGLRNYNDFRFVFQPTITWHVNRAEAIQLILSPAFRAGDSSFLLAQYQYRIK